MKIKEGEGFVGLGGSYVGVFIFINKWTHKVEWKDLKKDFDLKLRETNFMKYTHFWIKCHIAYKYLLEVVQSSLTNYRNFSV